VMAALAVARQLPAELGTPAVDAARHTFMDGLHAGSYAAAGATALTAVAVLVFLPRHDGGIE